MRILLVDDEEDILDMLKYNLEKEGYTIRTARNGEEGVKEALAFQPHLVLIDVMMPVMDGIEACAQIRDLKGIDQPIIAFLTSRAEDYSQIAGLDAGADDYITKPIRPRLLATKIESLLRRSSMHASAEGKHHVKEGLTIHEDRYMVELDGEELLFPKKEFELLCLLHSNPGKVHTRDEIMEKVWGNETIVGERTIDVHIRKLREKLGDDYIRTIKGVGYTFVNK